MEAKFEIKLKAKESINGYKIGETVIIVNPIFDRNIGIAFFPIDKNFEIIYQRQCTGIKYKTNRDIFEGDVFKRVDTGSTFLVVWHRDCFLARNIFDSWTKSNVIHKNNDCSLISMTTFNIEHIGDKYENPELLTAAN